MSQQAMAQMEQLSNRVKSLTDRCNSLQVQLNSARQQHADAAREAVEISDCKSANLDDLRNEVATKEAANEKMKSDLEQAIKDYDTYLTRIERALADPESMAALLLELEGNKLAQPAAEPAATTVAPTLVFADSELI